MDFALFETVRSFNYLTGDSKLDDDFADRLNRYWTTLIMILFAVVLSAKQIVGDPMKCWTPAEFKGAWVQYAEDFCWVKNTYFVPHNEELASDPQVRRGQEIGYYQWIPYMMTVQAFMYYLPAMVWRILNWKSGLDLSTLITRAVNQEKLDGVIYQLSSNMRSRSTHERRSTIFTRNFLTCLYLITKLLYTANAIGQFLLLSSFFGKSISAVFLVARDLALGVEWHKSGHFPRVTFCDFPVRMLGNTNSYTLQCVLSINIFTEKIFVFAGFWMLFVACVTTVNCLSWLAAILLPWRRLGFLRRLTPAVSPRRLQEFLEERLGTDGLLFLQLVATNSDDQVAGRLLRGLLEHQDSDQKAGSTFSDPAEGLDASPEEGMQMAEMSDPEKQPL